MMSEESRPNSHIKTEAESSSGQDPALKDGEYTCRMSRYCTSSGQDAALKDGEYT